MKGGGGRGFILTERVKTQKPKHFTRWGGMGGNGVFSQNNTNIISKVPMHHGKKNA